MMNLPKSSVLVDGVICSVQGEDLRTLHLMDQVLGTTGSADFITLALLLMIVYYLIRLGVHV
jgi:hypothetical protein